MAAVLTTGGVAPATAQESGAIADERIQVTGSRISHVDAESANPVLSINRDDIERTGLTSIADLLQELSVSGASLNQLGSAGTSFGAANINLRNLGANRVLVLVNGRRWVTATGGRGFRDFVDLNSIPLAVVERIEILKDGASAIYGSDAIAGVVNIHTRQDYDGANARLQYGWTAEGDGEQTVAEITFGSVGARNSVMLSASFLENEPIFVDDRPWSHPPLGTLSLNTPQGRFVIPGVGTQTLIPGQPGTDPSHFRAFTNDDRVSQFPGTYLTQPIKRTNVYGQSRHRITDTIDMFTEALYNRRVSEQNFSAAVPTISGANRFTVPADHQFNPWGIDLAAGWSANLRIDDNGQRVNTQHVDTFRYVLGFDGVLRNGWRWDASTMYAKNDAVFTAHGQISLDRLALGIGDVARCAAIAGCVPLNIFGGPGSWTQEQLDWIRLVGKDHNGTRMNGWQVNLTGDLFQMPAGALAFATGFEHRKESGFDNPDALVNSPALFVNGNSTTGQPREPTFGEYDLDEYYVEFNIPVFAALELNAAARHSDYSTFGSTTTTKFGAMWRPVDSLLLRATYSEGFRAPSILELFAGRRTTNLPATDPCTGGPTAATPGCAGVPASYIQSGSTVVATVGSNPLLQPETSETVTAGFVWSPTFVPNFDMTVDWYRVKVEDAITSIGSQRILDDCAFAQIRCNLITRDATGEILNLIDAGVNIASQHVSGFDLGARYRMPATRIGELAFLFDAAYLHEFEERIPDPGSGTINIDRRHGGQFFRESYPRWKAQHTTQWFRDAWSATWRMRYIHSMTEASAQPDIGSVTYHDLHVGYRMRPWNTQWTFGVQNVFDKHPPTSLVNTNINFDISTYDPRGRSFFLRAVMEF